MPAGPVEGRRGPLFVFLPWTLLVGLCLSSVGVGLLVTGGSVAILPASWSVSLLPPGLVLIGVALALVSLLVGRADMVRGIWRSVPHLILRVPTVVNLGMTLIILGGAAILFHATTDFVGGTLAPGVGVGGVTGTLLWTDVDLTDAVSVLLMAWILILMAQLFLAGPSIDRSRRLKAAQGTTSDSQPPAISRRSIMTGGALVVVTGAVILEAAEVVTSAPPLLFWYATLPGAVIVGALVSLVVSFLDRGLRHLEADLTYLPVPPDDEPSPT